MTRSSGCRFVCTFLALALATYAGVPGVVEAQSLSEAEVSGRVRTVLGEAIPRPAVSVLDASGAPIRGVDGGLDGSFLVRGLGPGTYTLRVEALGFSPRVYVGLRLRPGQGMNLAVQLRPAGSGADTVFAGGTGNPPAAGRWIDAPDLASLPVESPDLASWASDSNP